MKLNIKDILAKITPALQFIRRYVVFIFLIILLFILCFFVFRINTFSHMTPTEDAVSAKLQTVQRPRIDQAVLDKIQELQNQNIQVQSLFNDARNNPFSE